MAIGGFTLKPPLLVPRASAYKTALKETKTDILNPK